MDNMAVAAPGRSTPSGSLTLRRALRLLDIVSQHSEGISVSQLATTMETHRAGVYRLVGPFLEAGLLERSEDGRLLFLGTGLIGLADQVRGPLQRVAGPILQQVADRLGVTTALTLRAGDEAVVARVLEPRTTSIHLTYRPGLRHALSVGAPGLAILAAGPPVAGERAEVTRARAAGWASSVGELLPGAAGVAVALDESGGQAASAISAVWVAEREVMPIVDALREAAASIVGRVR